MDVSDESLQPTGQDSNGGFTPAPPGTPTTPEPVLESDTDYSALEALLDGNNATAPDQQVTPDDDSAPRFGTKWDDLTDEELVTEFQAMTPKQVRAVIGNGKAMERRFQAGLRELAETRKALEQSRKPQPEAPQQAPTSELRFQDCFDQEGLPIEERFTSYIRQEAGKMASQTKEEIAAREFQRELDTKVTSMRKAFPHFNEPGVDQNVYNYMRQYGILDPIAAYASAYPRQYAEVLVEYERAQSRQKKSKTSPATPPNVSTKGEPPPPSDLEGMNAFASAFLAKRMGGGQ